MQSNNDKLSLHAVHIERKIYIQWDILHWESWASWRSLCIFNSSGKVPMYIWDHFFPRRLFLRFDFVSVSIVKSPTFSFISSCRSFFVCLKALDFKVAISNGATPKDVYYLLVLVYLLVLSLSALQVYCARLTQNFWMLWTNHDI